MKLSWPEPVRLSTAFLPALLARSESDAQNYSGDFGDLASFATHMRAMAASKGSDLLLMSVKAAADSNRPLYRYAHDSI